LASQKYTFGIQEYVTVGNGDDADVAESVIAKISASPAKYAAPKMKMGSTSLSLNDASATNPKPANTATETYAYAYQFGVYDNDKESPTYKTYLWFGIDELPMGFDFDEVNEARGTATFDTPSGKHLIGVREVITKTVDDTTIVIAASAVAKVSVKS
jgi:hypothetical protein